MKILFITGLHSMGLTINYGVRLCLYFLILNGVVSIVESMQALERGVWCAVPKSLVLGIVRDASDRLVNL